MQRMGSVIGLRDDKVEEYKRLHAAVWPEVKAMLTECGITNFSIYLKEPENLMFSYFEYVGEDFEADQKKMAAHPKTQQWWSVCGPCQEPLATRAKGEWWASMEEVFHQD